MFHPTLHERGLFTGTGDCAQCGSRTRWSSATTTSLARLTTDAPATPGQAVFLATSMLRQEPLRLHWQIDGLAFPFERVKTLTNVASIAIWRPLKSGKPPTTTSNLRASPARGIHMSNSCSDHRQVGAAIGSLAFAIDARHNALHGEFQTHDPEPFSPCASCSVANGVKWTATPAGASGQGQRQRETTLWQNSEEGRLDPSERRTRCC